MKRFFWILVFAVITLLLTVGFFEAIQYVYFSGTERGFKVMGILFSIILYSNILAVAYRVTQSH
jgi:hypothetical protein